MESLLKVTTPMMRGDSVRECQQILKNLSYNIGNVDGIYGPNTRDAVIQFQLNNGLQADGIVGPATWDKLRS